MALAGDTVDTAKETPLKTELLEKLDNVRRGYDELKRQRGTSDPAMRALFEEFEAINECFIDWEDQFVHQISATICTSAEASFVREETARQCKWQVYETHRKAALTGTYGAIATGVVDIPVQIGKQMLGLRLFVSPHVNDSLTLGRDVLSRISVRDGRLLLVKSSTLWQKNRLD